MPFSKTREYHTEEYWRRHFTSFLKPLIERNPMLEATRSEPLRGDIASQIVTDLTNDQIVVADLTDHNPNVFWELGVRQSFKHCTVTIAEVGTSIPFHLNKKGILFYNGEHLDNQEFEKQFGAALNNCLEYPDEPDSPVLVALGGRGTLYSLLHHEENSRRCTAVLSELKWNDGRMKSMMDAIKENENLRLNKKDSECQMATLTFRTIAAENLSVNRYLELTDETYDMFGTYHSWIDFLREQHSKWFHGNAKDYEEQLKKASDTYFKVSDTLKKCLELLK